MDAATGETVHTLRGHRDAVLEIRFSPDGSLVGSVSNDGELIVWDTATGRPLERWDTFDPWGVGFSPDNDLVYGGGGDSMLRTWDLSVAGHLPAADDPGRRRRGVRAGRPLPGRAAGGLSLARRPGHGMGQVRRHRHRRGDARHPPSGERRPRGPSAPGIPTVGSTSATAATTVTCAEPGIVTRPRLRHGQTHPETPGRCRRRRRASGHWRTSTRVAACSWATPTARTLIVDAETLRPRGEPFDVVADCCATPIGDGSTAMVYEHAGDRRVRALAGARRQHRRGAVRGGRGRVGLRLRRLSGRLDGRGGGGHRRDRHHRRLDRRRTAAIHRSRCRGLLAQLLRRRRAAGLRRRRRRGQPVGRHHAGPAGHRLPTPPTGSRSRRARSSSATPTTWRSRRTTAGSTGGRPTSTGPSTSPARWPDGT